MHFWMQLTREYYHFNIMAIIQLAFIALAVIVLVALWLGDK